MPLKEQDPASQHLEPSPIRWQKRTIRILIAILIVGIGIAGGAYLKKSAPKASKRTPQKRIPMVETRALQHADHQAVISAMGTVSPARRITLRARVAGQILSIHPDFAEGGFLVEGETVIRIDDADYLLALEQKKSELTNSHYALKLESGRQEVAQREWEILNSGQSGETEESELALRKPHLEKAQADAAAARAAVEKAALDLERTRIKAPFNAMVLSREVDVGSQVSPQEPLAELVGTDVYWVKAAVPVDRLDWIRIPQRNQEEGAAATVFYGHGHSAKGNVIRLLGDLDPQGLMARILIEVPDPFNRKEENGNRPPLLIGDYVRVEIEGSTIENAFTVPRFALRDDNTLWLLNADMTLDIRQVTPVWRDAKAVVITEGVRPGEQLIISDLAAPVVGMELQTEKPLFPQSTQQQGEKNP